jgi:hypothetical protein
MDTKSWYKSKTIWGGILMLLSLVLTQVTGIQISPEEQDSTGNLIVGIAQGFGSLIGLILVIVGRIKATKKIAPSNVSAKSIIAIFILGGLIFGMTACGTISRTLGISPDLQKQWQAATEEERVRLVLKDIQSSLDTSLDIGALYVATHPEKKADWKNLVLPLFKKANDVIGDIIFEAKTTQGKITLAAALLKVQPHILEVERILLEWGAKK